MLLLIGNGYMGKEYIKSLKKLNISFIVVGNTDKSCKETQKIFPGIKIYSGGIQNFLEKNVQSFDKCIITSPIHLLEKHLTFVLEAKINDILIEKPGGLNTLKMINVCNKYQNENIVVAYNRRFYNTTEHVKQIIQEDGGVSSFSMEITELIHRINPNKYAKETLDKWFLSMTTHVVDLAFYLGGNPIKMTSFVNEGKDWYKKAGVFCGCGQTTKGALFSYNGDWTSSGRWGIKIYTPKHLIILSPLEKIKIQNKGELDIKELDITNDKEIKAGIFNQTKCFIENPNDIRFLNYNDQCQMIKNVYNKMLGY